MHLLKIETRILTRDADGRATAQCAYVRRGRAYLGTTRTYYGADAGVQAFNAAVRMAATLKPRRGCALLGFEPVPARHAAL